jgi:hypothetical protein
VFEVQENEVQVVGLHFRGPAPAEIHNEGISDRNPYVHAIRVRVDTERERAPQRAIGLNVVIADNEFEQWSGAGVELIGSARSLSRNGLRECGTLNTRTRGTCESYATICTTTPWMGGGYGVSVSGGAYATVEANVFEFNRHAVAAGGNA